MVQYLATVKDQGRAKSSMASTGINSPIIFLNILVFHHYVMNRSLYGILMSLSPKFGKNYQFSLKLIFYLSDNQTL